MLPKKKKPNAESDRRALTPIRRHFQNARKALIGALLSDFDLLDFDFPHPLEFIEHSFGKMSESMSGRANSNRFIKHCSKLAE